jgi:hypothetical protein
MAETVRCILEVYSAPTFNLTTPVHSFAGVVGDVISFVVTPRAVAEFAGTVQIVATGIPAGGSVSYSPTGPVAMDTPVTVTVDTGVGPAGSYSISIGEA